MPVDQATDRFIFIIYQSLKIVVCVAQLWNNDEDKPMCLLTRPNPLSSSARYNDDDRIANINSVYFSKCPQVI